MITVDWYAVLWGFGFGAPAGALFFAGLAWSIRRAMTSAHSGLVLSLSSLCRIGALLTIGYWVMLTGKSAWSLAGFMLAFFLARLLAVLWMRVILTRDGEGKSCS